MCKLVTNDQNFNLQNSPNTLSKPAIKSLNNEIKQYVYELWQNEWQNHHSSTKLYPIMPVPSTWCTAYRKNRREEVILARLRTGHTHYTHSYLLDRKTQPTCEICQCPQSISTTY